MPRCVYAALGFRDRGENDRAISEFSEAIQLRQNFAQAVCFRGLLHDAAGDHELAIADYNQSIFLDPAFFESAGNNRAVAYFHKRDYSGAIANFSELLARHPANRPARIFRGAIYMLMGRDDDAIADFDEYSRMNPQAALGLYGRGLVQLRNGDDLEAAKADPARRARQDAARQQGEASISAAQVLNAGVAELWAREIGPPPWAGATGSEIAASKSTERIPPEK